jgi:hypothetical protein
MKPMKHLVKFLTVVEIEVNSEEYSSVEFAQAKLDAFREATLPSENYGVTLYRATPEDLSDDLSRRQVEVIPLFREDDDDDVASLFDDDAPLD